MTLDLKNMTQAEFDNLIAEIKTEDPNLFQLIEDFVNRKVTSKEVDDLLKMEQSEQMAFIKNYKARA
ncbi:hypothetical protein MK482_01470 [Streptococcus mitis]|jgi:hypothetical protein|uniref:hypothetical protein n=1 Tax=Streptococcus mitis TaxID=28037 RepID=UPI0022846164|nr:hypothetical protein [Streptococcus mitis]MCY7163188.1 hypothetical protein [Streptococcus mitis]